MIHRPCRRPGWGLATSQALLWPLWPSVSQKKASQSSSLGKGTPLKNALLTTNSSFSGVCWWFHSPESIFFGCYCVNDPTCKWNILKQICLKIGYPKSNWLIIIPIQWPCFISFSQVKHHLYPFVTGKSLFITGKTHFFNILEIGYHGIS